MFMFICLLMCVCIDDIDDLLTIEDSDMLV